MLYKRIIDKSNKKITNEQCFSHFGRRTKLGDFNKLRTIDIQILIPTNSMELDRATLEVVMLKQKIKLYDSVIRQYTLRDRNLPRDKHQNVPSRIVVPFIIV